MQISPLKSLGKACDYTTRKYLSKSLEKGRINEAAFASSMLVLSIVSKDLVGCFLYTTQSWNNKKIPEDKRKFVAMTDLMNGIVMVGGQFIAGKLIERKFTPKLFGQKLSGLVIDKDTKDQTYKDDTKPLAEANIKKLTQESLAEKVEELKKIGVKVEEVNLEELGKKMVKKFGAESKSFKNIDKGFGILVTAIATTALVKRTLAPLISTPMASWFKGKYIDSKDPKAVAKNGAKQDVKTNEKPNSDDLLLSHEVAPWNYSNKDGDKATFKKIATK